jgi:oligoendopeptidase F
MTRMRTMTASSSRSISLALALAVLTVTIGAQTRDRSKTPEKFKWNLTEIYPTDAAWRTAKDTLTKDLPKLRQFQGKLTSSAGTLADALELQANYSKTLSRLYSYASLLADQDTRDSAHEGMRQEMNQLGAAFGAESSFIEPELLKGGADTVKGFVAAEPRLKIYSFYLSDVFRRAAHTLTDAEEKLLADVGPLAGNPSSLYNILSNADFPYPTVTLAGGRTVKLDQAAYTELRALPNRADREKVMSAFFGSLASFGRTFGVDERRSVESAVLREGAQVSVALESQLDGPNIPSSVSRARRRGQQEPAGLSSLPEAARADDEDRHPALLRSVRATGRFGRSEIHARRGAETRAGCRGATR